MMDFITYTGSTDKDMYVLQCAQGMKCKPEKISPMLILGLERNFLDNIDPFTHYVGDWEGMSWSSIYRFQKTETFNLIVFYSLKICRDIHL